MCYVHVLALYTDGVDLMVSTSSSGNVAVWDLNEKRLASILYGAHQSLAAATFFNNEPILATNGADNAIKVIIIKVIIIIIIIIIHVHVDLDI